MERIAMNIVASQVEDAEVQLARVLSRVETIGSHIPEADELHPAWVSIREQIDTLEDSLIALRKAVEVTT